jgi:FtsP/CotA-like multicopper oxidase with cupredoxin domain
MNNYRAFEDIELSGNSREYTLVVHRVPVTWEGYDKSLIVINGTSPGPILTVTLGDVLVVHLINMLEDDETTLHFHGLSMRNTPWMDGIVNVTQCPVGSSPRNQSITYRMVPQSPGTYWYHGHFHNQYPDGKWSMPWFLPAASA